VPFRSAQYSTNVLGCQVAVPVWFGKRGQVRAWPMVFGGLSCVRTGRGRRGEACRYDARDGVRLESTRYIGRCQRTPASVVKAAERRGAILSTACSCYRQLPIGRNVLRCPCCHGWVACSPGVPAVSDLPELMLCPRTTLPLRNRCSRTKLGSCFWETSRFADRKLR
jgi:hypothetical protein